MNGFGKTVIFCCLVFFANAVQAKDEGVICHKNNKGFLVVAPTGWVSDTTAGKAHGICTFFYPEGASFNNAETIAYPRLVDTPQVDDVVEYFVEDFSKGKNVQVKPGPEIMIKDKSIQAHTRYFKGEPPNEYELVGYFIYEDVTFLLVLSSRTEKGLKEAEPVFAELLKNVMVGDIKTKTEK